MLPTSFKSNPKSLYLLSSDEPLLQREWLDAARKSMQASGIEEIVSHRVETGFDWQALLQDGMSMSLFSDRKCHIIQFNSNKPGQAGAKFIGQICEQPPEDTIFILVMPKLDMATKKSAWIKKVMQGGELCELAPVYSNQLADWISHRGRDKGLMLDMQAAMYLADLTEGNLLASDQELEKLALALEPNTSVNAELIQKNISRSSRYTHYLLVDACLEGKLKRAIKIVQSLKLEGFQPIQIQYALHSALEILIQLKQAQQQHQLNPAMWQKLRVWKSKQALYNKALNRLTLNQLERLLSDCAKLDRINKGQQQPLYLDEEWHTISELVNALSGFTLQRYQTA